jgi:translation initiation factor 2 beta subunit (eIF-2beta)/eIF-5
LDADDVLKNLDKFIDMFILCERDNTPEVVIQVEGDEVFGKCNACGHVKKLD